MIKVSNTSMALTSRGISFVKRPHAYMETSLIDETYSQAPIHIPGFTITLYDHQRAVVQAMIDLENNPCIIAYDMYDSAPKYLSRLQVNTNAMILAEPFGSGKTIELLALILSNPIPKAYTTHLHTLTIKSAVPLIKSTLIIVGSSVLYQWANVIKDNTPLKVFVVENHACMKKLIAMFPRLPYDIILLKNGIINGELSIDTLHRRASIEAIRKLTLGHTWARVIYDDFDTIKIPTDAKIIVSLFTIYVSATKKKGNVRSNDQAHILDIPLWDIHRDGVLCSNFTIKSSKVFDLPCIQYHKYVVRGVANALNNALIGVCSNEMLEMLNGGAVQTAAEQLGISAKNTADIVEAILDKKYAKYIRAKKYCAYLQGVREQTAQIPVGLMGDDLESVLEDIRKQCSHMIYSAKINCAEIGKLLEDLHNVAKNKLEDSSRALTRVTENIAMGECQICLLPLQDLDVFIMKCCGMIVCDECGIKGNSLKRKTFADGKTLLAGTCGNCLAPISHNTMIFVNKSFDITKLNVTEDNIDITASPEPDGGPAPIKNEKLVALMEIINGKFGHAFSKNIPGLLNGKTADHVNAPERIPLPEAKKILIYAKFNESLTLICDHLQAHGVRHLRLRGRASEISRCINEFKYTDIPVLIINSEANCAGMNLEFATDIIFFHVMIDPNVEAQVVGRGQRIGRTSNLRVHYIMYDNEHGR